MEYKKYWNTSHTLVGKKIIWHSKNNISFGQDYFFTLNFETLERFLEFEIRAKYVAKNTVLETIKKPTKWKNVWQVPEMVKNHLISSKQMRDIQ